jgi:hypothetical protein
MTNIPANLFSGDVQTDLARAIALLQSIATPSPAAALNAMLGTAVFKASPGVRGFFDSFQLTEVEGKTVFKAELPCNVKLLGTYGDVRKAIAPLASVATAAWNGTAGTGTATPAADTLERYAYDRALAFLAGKEVDESITMTPKVDALTGRSYLSIEGMMNGTVSSLLAGSVVQNPT